MKDNRTFTKYIASFLLGDSSICIDKRTWGKSGNAYFDCCQIEDHLDYLEWMKEILDAITNTKLIEKPGQHQCSTFPNGITSKIKKQYRVRTNAHPFFNKFRERMYGTGKKAIDRHYFTLFDWETLAIWYMDDGYISNYVTNPHGTQEYRYSKLGLSTQGFTQSENYILKKFLKEKFDLEFNLLQNKYPSGIKYRLVINPSNIPKFLDGVSKYILPSFEYKLNYKHEKLLKEAAPLIEGEEMI